ncbi:MAG: hypothetical protein QXT38_02605 [Candidatus Aenigmatarchaeota archaeon]
MKIKNQTLIIIFLSLILYLIFRITFFTPVFSDETIYINMAKAIRKGLIPYKDFFYAHPPLQLFLLAPLTFFENFLLVKIFISLIGFSCLVLTYLISQKIFKKEAALITFFSFLFFPGFLIFGNLAIGTFEALFFFLLSFYFLLKKRFILSTIFLSFSIFTRYLVLLLTPFLIVYVFKESRKNFRNFLLSTLLSIFLFSIFFYSTFGKNFLTYTIFYHLKANLEFNFEKTKEQYFLLGFFTIFISITSFFYNYLEKNHKILLFSLYPIFYDSILLIILKQPFYHYFTLSLPLVFISFGFTIASAKQIFIRFFFLFILISSIFSNFQSLDFYFNKNKNLIFEELTNYTLKNTQSDDLIFGTSIPTNYISFVTNRKIVNNYFDCDLKFVNFVGIEKILKDIKEYKPKLIFADQFYLQIFNEEYKVIKEWKILEDYTIFLMEKK